MTTTKYAEPEWQSGYKTKGQDTMTARPKLQPDQPYVLKNDAGEMPMRAFVTSGAHKHLTKDVKEARQFRGAYLTCTFWDWPHHWTAVPVKPIPAEKPTLSKPACTND